MWRLLEIGRYKVTMIKVEIKPVSRKRQKGATLIVGLAILLVLTILGVSTMQSTLIEEKMAGNLRNTSVAFQAAEAALREGEYNLSDSAYFDGITDNQWETSSDNDGYYAVDNTTELSVIDPFDDARYGLTMDDITISDAVASPKYYLELIPDVPVGKGSLVKGLVSTPAVIDMYRVTARGEGVNDKAVVILQSTFFR